jgi:hypothetical protein
MSKYRKYSPEEKNHVVEDYLSGIQVDGSRRIS